MSAVQDIYACDAGRFWLWEHGTIPAHKFKGRCLSRVARGSFDGIEDGFDVRVDIVKAKVHHGWVITIVGDTSGCGWDTTTWFLDAPPLIEDGHWAGATDYEDPAEVVDGPHVATWLELG